MDSQKSFFGTPKKAFIFIVCVLAALSLFIIGTTFAVTSIMDSSSAKQAAENNGNDVLRDEKVQNENNTITDQNVPVIEDDTTALKEDSLEDGSNLPGKTGTVSPEMEAEKAQGIAVSHAGFSVSDVSFSKTELENEHGTLVYEIEFYKDGMEYEYEINAETGEIIKFEVDKDN